MTLAPHEERRLRALVAGSKWAGDDGLTDQQRARFDELMQRRLAGEPLQYLEGTAQFGPIEVAVDSRALIPRPETERVWEEAVTSLGDAGPGTTIVDLGTGSGVLALALKHAFPAARVIGVDVSGAALELAADNGDRLGLDVEWLQGDLFEPLPDRVYGRVDLVVSNPPYVSEGEFASLPVDVRDHEPREALVAGPEGTEVLARIAEEAFWWVGVGGWVITEIGETQGAAASQAFAAFDNEVRLDLAGRDRILVARKGASCCV